MEPQIILYYRVKTKPPKSQKIKGWINQGIISNNWEETYDRYIKTLYCEKCDCKLVKPKLVVSGDRPDKRIVPWLDEYTNQDAIMIRSDDVLTFVEPITDLLDYYVTIT